MLDAALALNTALATLQGLLKNKATREFQSELGAVLNSLATVQQTNVHLQEQKAALEKQQAKHEARIAELEEEIRQLRQHRDHPAGQETGDKPADLEVPGQPAQSSTTGRHRPPPPAQHIEFLTVLARTTTSAVVTTGQVIGVSAAKATAIAVALEREGYVEFIEPHRIKLTPDGFLLLDQLGVLE